MQCPRCQHENTGGKFCGECGARLELRCPACGEPNPPTNKFCQECGERFTAAQSPAKPAAPSPVSYTPQHLAERIVSSRGALEGERKQVTVLFADLKGSMELLADRDPEEARAILDPVLERMMDAVHRYEGTVNQVMGDGIMALFGAPLAHEDHAIRACYAALRMQESVKQYADEVRRAEGIRPQIRVGLNSGEVVVRSIGSDLRMDYTAVGQTTHLAARMEQLAAPGSILLAPETRRLVDLYIQVKALGPLSVKGLSEPVEVYEALRVGPLRTRLQAAAARGLTQFVGRDAELARLWQALERARTGDGQVVALVGEPGVGKSRLVYELTRSPHTWGWRVLEGSSVSYGRATAYLPMVDLLRAYFELRPEDDDCQVREKLASKLRALDPGLEPALPAFLALLGVAVDDRQWQTLDPRERGQLTLHACRRLMLQESQVQPLLLVFEDLHWIDAETQALLDSLVEGLPTAHLLLLVNYRPQYQHNWGGRPYFTELKLDPLSTDGSEALLEALVGRDPSLQPLKRLLIERTAGIPFFLEETVRTLVETRGLLGERGAYRLAEPVGSVQVPATVQAILAARIDRLLPGDKQLLQAAAVIGKDVPYVLLDAIAELPQEALHAGIARLQAAELLHEISIPPQAKYTFEHALTHEVAYQGLLVSSRTALHGRVAETLERLCGGRAERLEDLVALGHHFSLSSDKVKGARYLMAAGDRACGMYANEDAARHYRRALEIFQRTDFTLVEQEQARESLADVLAPVGLRAEALSHYAAVLAAYEQEGNRPAQARLRRKMGALQWAAGDRDGTLAHYQAGLTLLAAETEHIELAQLYQEMGRLAFRSGDVQQAIDWAQRALTLAERLVATTPGWRQEATAATAQAHNTLGVALARAGQLDVAVAQLERGLAVALEHELLQAACRAYTNLSVLYSTLDPQRAIETCLAGLELAKRIGDLGLQPWLYANLAAAYCTFTGKCEEQGIAAAETAIDLDQQLGQRDHLAVPLIVLGQIYQCHGEPARALHYYREALHLAEEIQEPQLLFPCYDGLASLYLDLGDEAQAEHYLLKGQQICEQAGLDPDSLVVLPFLS
jgi:predicted ATPase/class 3 adenylate cyclase